MKFLNRIIYMFLVFVTVIFFQTAKCEKSEKITGGRTHFAVKMKAKSHSAGNIRPVTLPRANYKPIIRTHAQVRNELVKDMFRSISHAICRLFSL